MKLKIMVTILKKGTSKKSIQKILQKIRTKRGLDAFKYCGIIKLKEDPLLIQKQMRNEWE